MSVVQLAPLDKSRRFVRRGRAAHGGCIPGQHRSAYNSDGMSGPRRHTPKPRSVMQRSVSQTERAAASCPVDAQIAVKSSDDGDQTHQETKYPVVRPIPASKTDSTKASRRADMPTIHGITDADTDDRRYGQRTVVAGRVGRQYGKQGYYEVTSRVATQQPGAWSRIGRGVVVEQGEQRLGVAFLFARGRRQLSRSACEWD